MADDSYQKPEHGTVSSDPKTKNSAPTLYPEIEFVNRTEPTRPY